MCLYLRVKFQISNNTLPFDQLKKFTELDANTQINTYCMVNFC